MKLLREQWRLDERGNCVVEGEQVTEVNERTVTLGDWLSGRCPPHLSTNTGADIVAFQSWRNFKEAFAPELIGQAFEETSRALGREVATSIDPFGGSGTTALASQFLGIRPVTIEVNPYLADLIEAKLASYDVELLLDSYRTLLARIIRFEGNAFPGAPATFVEPGVKGRYIFSGAVAAQLAGIRHAIEEIEQVDYKRLFRVLLGSIALPVSNVVLSGKGRRYRRGWETRPANPQDVVRLFDQAFVQAIYDIRRYRSRRCLKYELLRGDCRELIPKNREFDLAVFSPPYPNSFDYTDVYNVELWVCGYLTNAHENRQLRMQTLRSHVQIRRSYEAQPLCSPTLERVSQELDAVRHRLWNRTIPEMVRAYFADMQIILNRLSTTLTVGGRAYLVVGDSRYQGIQIPVGTILTELAQGLGLTKLADEPFRSMRVSPQQGGRPELVETLLTLQRS